MSKKKIEVGDLVALYGETGVWSRNKDARGEPLWISHGKIPTYCIVDRITEPGGAPHTGEDACCIRISCADLTGAVGNPPWSWVSEDEIDLIMKSKALRKKLR